MLCDHVIKTPHAEQAIFASIKREGRKVVLWGAGEMSLYVVRYLQQNDISVECYCDSDGKKNNTFFMGIPVFNYENMKKYLGVQSYHILISTGPQYVDEIRATIVQKEEKNPISYLRGYEIVGDKIDYPYFQVNQRAFERAYALMEDKISKKVFENVLNAKLTGDFSFYEQIKSDDEYFDPEVVRLTDRETFLNIGAFRGNDILEFAKKTSGNYEKIIGFEPDSKTAVELKERLEANRIERVEIYNIGAWSDHDTLAFDSFVGGSSQLASDKAISLDNYVVEVNAIDNILGTTPVTYLQMDIEGAEYNALLGAENTIKRDVPKMAISVYHRREDLFKLPLLVHSFVPSYRFYLRHYTDIQTETVLYCLNS